MVRFTVFIMLLAALAVTNAVAQSGAAAELTFSFTRQTGSASNQQPCGLLFW